MPAKISTQKKTPFAIDPRPLDEMSSPHAGLLATSRAFRSLGVPAMIEANLSLKARKRGFTEGEFVEAILLLQTAGGDCPEDARLLVGDRCLVRGLGFEMPKATASGHWLCAADNWTPRTPAGCGSSRAPGWWPRPTPMPNWSRPTPRCHR